MFIPGDSQVTHPVCKMHSPEERKRYGNEQLRCAFHCPSRTLNLGWDLIRRYNFFCHIVALCGCQQYTPYSWLGLVNAETGQMKTTDPSENPDAIYESLRRVSS